MTSVYRLPADQASTDLVASTWPKPHANSSPMQPSELPTSLLGYIIELKQAPWTARS